MLSLLPAAGILLFYLGLTLLSTLPALFLGVLIHEAGHAVCGTLAGFRVTAFGLGAGRPLLRLRLPGDILFFVCRDTPLIGTCWTITSEVTPSRQQQCVRLLGGVLANFLAGTAFYLLYFFHVGPFLLHLLGMVLALYNLYLGITNLFPFLLKPGKTGARLPSDGYQISSLFFSRHSSAVFPGSYLAFRPLWEALKDTRSLRYHLFLAAYTAYTLSDGELAARYVAEAESLPPDEMDGHFLLLHGLLCPDGSTEQKAMLERAEQEYRRRGSRSGIWLTQLHQIAHSASDASADARLEALWERYPLPKTAFAHVHFAAQRILVFTRNPANHDLAGMETRLAQFEAARQKHRVDVVDAETYSAVARWRKQNNDAVGARLAWERAEQAIRAVAQTLDSTPESAERWRETNARQAAALGYPSPFEALARP